MFLSYMGGCQFIDIPLILEPVAHHYAALFKQLESAVHRGSGHVTGGFLKPDAKFLCRKMTLAGFRALQNHISLWGAATPCTPEVLGKDLRRARSL